MSCTGGARTTCSITLKLTVIETIRRGEVFAVTASAKLTKKVLVLGTKTVTLAGGQSKLVTVSLNPGGRRLLSRRHTLKVKLAISHSTKTFLSTTITFKQNSKKSERPRLVVEAGPARPASIPVGYPSSPASCARAC